MARMENQRRDRIRRFINSRDTFYGVAQWPMWAQRLLYTRHKRNRDRYSLMFFLCVNGVNPEIAADWVLMTDVVGPHARIVSFGYDQSAKYHVRVQMVGQAKRGDRTFYRPGKRYYDMVAGALKTLPEYH